MLLLADTNTIVSGLIWQGPPREIVRLACDGGIQLLTSEPLLAELADVLLRDKFAGVMRQAGLAGSQLVEDIVRIAYIVEPASLPRPVCRDPEDDVVLATALAGRADIIVSGDKDLLVLGSFQGIPISDARSALARIG